MKSKISGFVGWSGLVAYLCLITFPKAEVYEKSIFAFQVIGFLVFVICTVFFNVTKIFNFFLKKRYSVDNAIVLAFFVWLAFSSLFAVDMVRSLSYVIVTWLVFVGMQNLWSVDKICKLIASYAIALSQIGFAVYQIAIHGVGPGRYVGVISPNHIGNIALSGMLFGFFAGGFLWRASLAVSAIAIALLVSSRGTLVSIGVFLCFLLLCKFLSLRQKTTMLALLSLALPICVLCFVVFFPMEELYFWVDRIFLLEDAERGLGSGLTSRTYLWSVAMANFLERPVLGYGFRASTSEYLLNSHSAYINLARDAGVVGFALFAIFVASRVWAYVSVITAEKTVSYRWHTEEASIALSALASSLFLGVVEIHLFNVGFPIGLLSIYLLAYRKETWQAR